VKGRRVVVAELREHRVERVVDEIRAGGGIAGGRLVDGRQTDPTSSA